MINLKDKIIWNSFLTDNKTRQQRIELTSAISSKLLSYGIDGSGKYHVENKVINNLFSRLPTNQQTLQGFEALKDFPEVASEIFNRYNAMKHEVQNAGLDTLIIGACGLSPLGIAVANSSLSVYDTDLADVVQFRKKVIPNQPYYQIHEWDLLSMVAPDFPETSRNVGILVEGLTFYLDEEQRHALNVNSQKTKETVSPEKPMTLFFDYYVSDVPARIRDTLVLPEHPDWKDFSALVSNIHDGQRAFFESREKVIKYLISEGYNNVRASKLSSPDNAHTVFVCEY